MKGGQKIVFVVSVPIVAIAYFGPIALQTLLSNIDDSAPSLEMSNLPHAVKRTGSDHHFSVVPHLSPRSIQITPAGNEKILSIPASRALDLVSLVKIQIRAPPRV